MSAAVEFRVSVPRYLLVRGATTISPSMAVGPLGGLRLVDRERSTLPAEDWVGIDVLACGICGTDTACLSFRGPTALEPFASFPAVMGHEVLGRVARLGSRVEGLSVGDRVVVNPLIDCGTRGHATSDFCGACRRDVPGACERAGSEGPLMLDGAPLARGSIMGFHAQLSGGWSETMMASARQVFKVPDGLDDRKAVLTEPLAVSVRGVVQSWQAMGDNVLVLGAGPIGLGTVWALRALGYTGRIVLQAKRQPEGDVAKSLGADAVNQPSEARDELMALGATSYKPMIGDEVYMGGFDTVFDCVGSSASYQQALKSTRAGGQVTMLGCCTELQRIDQTFLWARQLTVRGFIAYGPETWQSERLHTFELTLRLLSQTRSPIDTMVTHDFPLSQYAEALKCLLNRSESGAIKVVLHPEVDR